MTEASRPSYEVLAGLTDDQRIVLRNLLCPGCAYDLPEIRFSNDQMWRHHLPKTEFKLDCRANDFRNELYNADRYMEKKNVRDPNAES